MILVLSIVLGLILIAIALRDIFLTLFQPGALSSVSAAIARRTWRATRFLAHRRPSLLTLAGPTALVGTIAAWGALLIAGWALLYWPFLPDAFLLQSGLSPDANAGLLDALYLSLVTLATLGYGDITPTAGWLRLLAPLEAVVGFVLLSASIAWLLSLYPTLARRRALAHEVALLQDAAEQTGITMLTLESGMAAQLLADLTARLVTVRGDFTQFPITYYFHARDARMSLALALPLLDGLAEAGMGAGSSPAVRLQAGRLRAALEELAGTLARQYFRGPDRPLAALLRAYQEDHLRQRPSRPELPR